MRAARPSLLLATILMSGAAPLRASDLWVAAQGGYFDMAGARRSMEAVVGSSGFGSFGAEWGYGIHRGLFAAVGFSFFPSKEGERVFLAGPGDRPFPLGFPLRVSRTAAHLNVGWRFFRAKRFSPYAAIGAELVSLKETSEVAGETIEEAQSKGGFRGLVGVEYRATRRLLFGAEIIGSTVPNAIGVSGVSRVYAEDDIGGLAVLGKVIYRFGR